MCHSLPQVVGAVSAVSTSICHDPVLLRNGAAEMVDTIQPFPKSYSEEEEEQVNMDIFF